MATSANRDLESFLAARPLEELSDLFARHGVAESSNVHALVTRIRIDGSNSIGNWARDGEGIDYDEIVRNVAKRLKVKAPDSDELSVWEKKVVDYVIDQLPPESRESINTARDRAGRKKRGWKRPAGGAAIATAVTVQVWKQYLRREAAKRAAGSWVPGVNIALWLATGVEVATSPAYRKVIPTVIDVSLMRYEAGVI